MDEFEFIDRIRTQAHRPADSQITIGIGDDAAALKWKPERETIVATDMLMEGVHFDFDIATQVQAGRKALAVNLSDLAAMAAIPRYALVSLAFSAHKESRLAEEVMQGMFDLAKQFDVAIIGGDTNSWNGPCVLSVTVIGEASARGVVTRAGAQVGDAIYVTGDLGGSLSGKHLTFLPRVREALLLHQHLEITSMIDLSDGLASDLRHITHASEVGAIIQQAAIPLSKAVTQLTDGHSSFEHAIGDGEDFELLFTAPEEAVSKLPEQLLSTTTLTKIGEVVAERSLHYQDDRGNILPLPETGWRHRL